MIASAGFFVAIARISKNWVGNEQFLDLTNFSIKKTIPLGVGNKKVFGGFGIRLNPESIETRN